MYSYVNMLYFLLFYQSVLSTITVEVYENQIILPLK